MRTLATRARAINQYNGLGNQLWDLAGNRPSLDLRFADDKSLVDATTGTNLVTFSRASSGTYVGSDGLIKTATTNAPRFDHDPTTGESLGLLVEESRTNNVLQSEDFATTWTVSNLTVTTNSVVAPDGTATADTIEPPTDGLTVTRFLRQNPALTTQQAYTFSVFVKVGTAATNGIALYVSDSTATNSFRANFNLFNLNTSTGATGWATPTATIIPYPNGWYRCILSGVTSTAHTALRAIIYLNAFGNTADNYGSIYLWGAQLEAGSFPTSYIPTEGTTVTRAADVASISGSNFSSWFTSPGENTFYAEYQRPPGTGQILEGYDGGNIVGMSLSLASTAPRTVARHGPSRCDTSLNGLPPYIAGTNKHVGATSASGSAAAANGTVLTTGTPGQSDWTATSSLAIGHRGAYNTERCNTTIKRITVWPQRLPNETLQTITN